MVLSEPFGPCSGRCSSGSRSRDGDRQRSKRPRQRNDCTVRAIAIACALSYDSAYDLLLKADVRKCSRGIRVRPLLVGETGRYANRLKPASPSREPIAQPLTTPTIKFTSSHIRWLYRSFLSINSCLEFDLVVPAPPPVRVRSFAVGLHR
jgi:hypothetical protein